MNKVKSRNNRASLQEARPRATRLRAFLRLLFVAVLSVTAVAVFKPSMPQAQRTKEQGASVTGVQTSEQGGRKVVSVSGEGAMNRVQTWQDPDGKFNIVFPHGKGNLPARLPGGVRAERVGDSLQLIIPAKRGSSVMVQPRAGGLDLVVNGELDEGGRAAQEGSKERPASASTVRGASEGRAQQNGAGRRQAAANDSVQPKREEQPTPEQNYNTASQGSQNAPVAGADPVTSEQPLSSPDTALNLKTPGDEQKPRDARPADAKAELSSEGSSSISSMTGLLVLLGVMALGGGLFLLHKRRLGASGKEKASSKRKKGAEVAEAEKVEETKATEKFELPEFEPYRGDRRKQSVPVAQERRRGGEDMGTRFNVAEGTHALERVGEKSERKPEARPSYANAPAVEFGAYRIDQEVGKLVEGQPHSIEVLASRASEDRRAIETSLVKVLSAVETTEQGRRRVRQALEDYGFVARQSATLLLSSDSYERVSAARILGQVKSRASLPFLLEALYDNEQVVRTETVASLGSLGMPGAIGALIDMARRYPEIPSSLISPALTACSFEAQDYLLGAGADGRGFTYDGAGESSVREFTGFEPATEAEQLPEWLEDENLADALERLESADVEARISAAQSLSQFSVRRSVEALSAILARDEAAAVRAAAVTSLGAIDHESVFAPVLVALADDSREVRAAAARAISSVNFDRADAAVRLIESGDTELLSAAAKACVKSGLAAQAASRLASEDRRQAYEAFSLLSLIVKGGEAGPIIEAIERHGEIGVRLSAVRLASLTGDPRLLGSLREMAETSSIPVEVRDAIIEATGTGAHANK